MPTDAIPPAVLPGEILILLVKVGLMILSGLYFIFSLIVIRQVNLMTETLITEVSPLIRFVAVLHAGLALGIIILFVGLLF